MWQRQVLIYYLLPCQSCPGVSLADPRMAWEALTSHYLPPNQAMTQIRLRAMTAYPRSVATEDAYVVEHGRLLHKLAVEMKLRVGVADGECPLDDECGVGKENIPKLVGLGIIFVNDLVVVHI